MDEQRNSTAPDRTQRREHGEPEEHAEHLPVAAAEQFLQCQPADVLRKQRSRLVTAPVLQTPTRLFRFSGLEQCRDLLRRLAVILEPGGEIQHHHVERPAQHAAEVTKPAIHQSGDQQEGNHPGDPRNCTLHGFAAIHLVLQESGIAGIGLVRAQRLGQGAIIFKRDGSQERCKNH